MKRKKSLFSWYYSMADRSDLQTRSSLLLRVRDTQDVEAWQAFMEIYAPLIYGYCRFRRLQEADAADVTQEVLTKVVRSMDKFVYRPERGRFRDWLGKVTRGELIRYLSKKDRAGGGEGPLESGSTSLHDSAWTDKFQSHVLATALRRIQSNFEPDTWRAFELVWLQNQTALQAAEALNQPIEKIYVAKSRVLKKLRQEVMSIAEELLP